MSMIFISYINVFFYYLCFFSVVLFGFISKVCLDEEIKLFVIFLCYDSVFYCINVGLVGEVWFCYCLIGFGFL